MNFRNEPFTDFSKPEAQNGIRQALAEVRRQLGRTYPLIIDGKKIKSRKSIRSINPSRAKEIVGIVSDADKTMADQALEAAARAYGSWGRVAPQDRTALLRRMAERLRERKAEFSAWLIFEVGKNWAEADADVAEAIDFLNYYAELSLLSMPVLAPVASEINRYRYEPLGPVVVVPPWNFPLAILVGMMAAAVVTGNTVVLKPSSQSPVIAVKFMELAMEAGLPPGVVNVVTGFGKHIGDYLVADPRTRMVAFTGSREVGLRIHALAGKTGRGQRWLKRVIAEMGGKNAIIVDASADLNQAAEGVVASAFGYQGQKCSACSRAYIHDAVYDDFLELLLQKTMALRLGPSDEGHAMGPVISEQARQRILRYVRLGQRQGRLLTGGLSAPLSGGFYVAPTVINELPETSRLWKEEIFGPVLAVRSVSDFAQGLRLANATDYGLTGSVYSADEKNLALAAEDFFCGNLYFNRKSTGALVGGHPFGGFNMSGTDSKAGGPDYLSLFRQAKCVSRKY